MTGKYYKTKESVKEYIALAKDVSGIELIKKLKQILPSNSNILEIGSGPGTDWKILSESYNAIASAKQSYNNAYPESASDASFHISNALEQFTEQDEDNKAQLILCKPPDVAAYFKR